MNFDSNSCHTNSTKGSSVTDSYLKRDVYKMNLKSENGLLVTSNVDRELWYSQLGHFNITHTNNGLVDGFD